MNVTPLRNTVVLLTASLLISGCVSIPPGQGFAQVQQSVKDRTGNDIRWNRGSTADAQTTAAVHQLLQHELSASDAVQIAFLNNQNLQAVYEDLGIAQAELVEAGLLRNPTFSAEFRLPTYRALPFDIDITQSFLDLLVMPLRKRVAGAALEQAKFRVTHEVLTTAANVKVAFYRAQGAAQLVEMRQSILTATEASLDTTRRLHDAGNVSDLTLVNERALHEQTRLDLAKAEREASDAREELTALLGLWGDDIGWKIAARLPDLPAQEPTTAHLESIAIAQRADLGAVRQDLELSAGRLGLTRPMLFGSDVSIGAHLSRETDAATSAGPSLSITLPLFNQGQPAIAAGEAKLRQSERRYTALAVQIRSEVRRARNNLAAARDLARYTGRVIVPLRHQIVEQNLLQFNAMQISVFELLQAKQAEIDAGREYVEALKTYWVSRCELERALGGQLPASAVTPTTQPTMPQKMQPDAHTH